MTLEFKFPDVGEGITEGTIVKWLVKEGDKVIEDQNIVDIETDKAVVQIPTPKAGTVLKIHVKEGEIIKVGNILVTIGEEGEKPKPQKIEKQEAPKKEKEIKEEKKIDEKEIPKKEPEKPKSSSVVGELEEAKGVMEIQPEKSEKKTLLQKILTTPAVRRLAKEKAIDLTKIKGSGPEGRITKEDLDGKAEVQKSSTAKITKKYDLYGYVERIPLKGIRKTIADNMTKAANAPLVTSMDEADITKLVEIRSKEKLEAQKRGIKLTYLPFIVKALIAALKQHSILNSSLIEDEIIIKKYYNIGIAVDSENGLIVPVIKGANNKSIMEIAKEIFDLAEKVKSRKIDLGDLQGSTFTITNYGSLRGSYATPIVNINEAAILGIGRIFDKPVMNNDHWHIKKILPLSLTFDHRILDGAQAARFMDSLIKHLEDPNLLLVDE